MVVVFTTKKGEYEGIIDQTMNFTALIVLIQLDNLVAGRYQNLIDNFEVDFKYKPETFAEEFKKCAEFMKERDVTGARIRRESSFLTLFGMIQALLVITIISFMLFLYAFF